MATYNDLGIEYSENVQTRNIKGLLWGGTGTWKTETVARNFPGLLLIDAEGNSDHLVKNPLIPPFLRVKTKDVRKIFSVFDAVIAGKVKMPDGSPIQTFCVDSISVLWSVQSEVAASLAEQRAAKYSRSADGALITLQDWGKAKRPLKSLLTRFNNAPIRYLILIAREKDLFEGEGNDLKRVGVTPDVIKGTEYEMNFCIHTGFDTDKKWFGEVTKVQGKLGTVFPFGKRLPRFPIEALLAYAQEELHPAAGNSEDETDLAGQIASEDAPVKTKQRLLEIAAEKGLDGQGVKRALEGAGLTYDVEKWDEMIKAIGAAVTAQ